MQLANTIGGRNGVGISHALENRIIGTKSRGARPSPAARGASRSRGARPTRSASVCSPSRRGRRVRGSRHGADRQGAPVPLPVGHGPPRDDAVRVPLQAHLRPDLRRPLLRPGDARG
eukprot:5658761-Prymnesium_polylepis.1